MCHRLTKPFLFSLLATCAAFSAGAAEVDPLPPSANRPVDFVREIQPLFEKHCLKCHGTEKQKGGYRLDRKDAALTGGDDHAPNILPGKSAESPLIQFVAGLDKEMRMPQKGDGLGAEQIGLLRAWIDQGAKWPEEGEAADPKKTHWAFQPVKRPPVPASGTSHASNPIDAFIAEKLASAGLTPATESDRGTLIRRLSFDLNGLPPSPDELAAFLADKAPGAYERLVERLLASPRYGERWARHWLDVVRFAESNGFETNGPRPNAWPYRDYVIQAFNADKPYNEFVREQIVGDATGADAATGFLVGGATDIVKSPDPVLTATQRADELNDMVSTTGNAFLGLTLNCARCHNHKFDPITQVDYYSMAAIFAGVKHGERDLKVPDQAERKVKSERLQRELDGVAVELARFEPMANLKRIIAIHPDDQEHTVKLSNSSSGRTLYATGMSKGEANYAGTAKDLPTLGDGYWVWNKENAKGDVFAWKPKSRGRFRVWVSWGSGYSAHDSHAHYLLDEDGNPQTTGDQIEIGTVDHRKFADGTGAMPNRKLWSGFKDLGVHEFTESSALLLRAGTGLPTADLLVLEEVEGESKASAPHIRLPVKRDGNTEHFAPIEAKFLRFTIRETTQLQPCIDELEVFSSEAKPRNVALGATPSASSTLPGYAIHQLKHINDGLYGNERSWISNEIGKGWVQLEFAKLERIERVVWSRDREDKPRYNDRLPTQYQIEVSTDGQSWKTVATAGDRLPQNTKISARTIARGEGLTPTQAQQFTKLEQQRTAFTNALREVTTLPRVYAGQFSVPGEMHRYQRGDVTQPKELMQPAVLASIGPKLKVGEGVSEQERRLALANWITDRNHPLTARVIVNRLWHYHFGTGLVDTPSDFGVNGGRPSNPALLDWLASELIEHGWSLKHIQRLIVCSAAYRQASHANDPGLKIDAGDRLLWRFPPRRLEAEALRDTMLAVSGSLDLKMGGPGFDLFEANTNYVKIYATKAEYGPAEFRRMVYQSKPRVQLDDIFGAFDCPDAGQIAPRRTSSTTPLQALNLLNSPFALQQAGAFAARLEKEVGKDPAAQVRRAFLLSFGREPDPEEAAAAVRLISEHDLKLFCRALFNTNEFINIF